LTSRDTQERAAGTRLLTTCNIRARLIGRISFCGTRGHLTETSNFPNGGDHITHNQKLGPEDSLTTHDNWGGNTPQTSAAHLNIEPHLTRRARAILAPQKDGPPPFWRKPPGALAISENSKPPRAYYGRATASEPTMDGEICVLGRKHRMSVRRPEVQHPQKAAPPVCLIQTLCTEVHTAIIPPCMKL